LAETLAFLVCLRLGEHESEDYEEDGGTGAEPEERSPGVGGGVDETSGECGAEKISKGVLEGS
jgi:hypothetical protein